MGPKIGFSIDNLPSRPATQQSPSTRRCRTGRRSCGLCRTSRRGKVACWRPRRHASACRRCGRLGLGCGRWLEDIISQSYISYSLVMERETGVSWVRIPRPSSRQDWFQPIRKFAINRCQYLRLISRNHGSFCWFLLNSNLCTLYCRPSSSRVMEILWPLGAVRWEY